MAELMDHLKTDAFWLYGHSMGSSIAMKRQEAAGIAC